ncbi:hypothetical protein B188_09320 [Candidatus Brocadiaceae bacterium B188]|nr:hypothetical protein B188_09320 [Candidatus Brocadiaceae bacterium B188]
MRTLKGSLVVLLLFIRIVFLGHRVVVWVLLYFLEHTGKDFQSEILLVT